MTRKATKVSIKRAIGCIAIALIAYEYMIVCHFQHDMYCLLNMASSFLNKDYWNKNTPLINFILINMIIIVLLADIIILYIKRNRKKKQEIEDLNYEIKKLFDEINNNKKCNKQQIKEVTHKMNSLIYQKTKIIKRQETEIANNSVLKKQYQQEVNDISEGIKFLFYIMNGEEDLKLNKQQTEKLLKCYKQVDLDFVYQLEHLSANSLTPKEELFCILYRLGKNKYSIMSILGLSKDGYRQLKFRTLKKIKEVPSLKVFCDKIEYSNAE